MYKDKMFVGIIKMHAYKSCNSQKICPPPPPPDAHGESCCGKNQTELMQVRIKTYSFRIRCFFLKLFCQRPCSDERALQLRMPEHHSSTSVHLDDVVRQSGIHHRACVKEVMLDPWRMSEASTSEGAVTMSAPLLNQKDTHQSTITHLCYMFV